MSPRLARLARLAGLAVALAGCARPTTKPPVSAPGTWGERLVAGVAREDITPPPGLSLLGHGPEGRVAAGTLLRLYCTAFVIGSGSEAIALLPCDLQAPSLELQREIAKLVHERDPRLGADRIFLMASHTHAAPGHYFGARQYGGTFSSRAPGFDPEVLGFLARRAADAVIKAAQKAEPAELGWRVHHCAGGGLVKNRSLPALRSNTQLPAALSAQLLRGCAGFVPERDTRPGALDRLAPAELAADLRLSVLRIDAVDDGGARRPLGAFGVFGIHNTAVPNNNDLYHSDVFGFAIRKAEQEIHRSLSAGGASAPEVLVGMANGVEGDVSPATTSPSVDEARRIGEELGRRVAQAFLQPGPTLPDDGKIARAYREVYLPGALAAPPDARGDLRLCEAPEIGAAAAGGAEDGPTWLRIFPQMKEGSLAGAAHPCHGRKLTLRSPGYRFSDDGLDFPNVAPLSLVRVGGALLAATPFEMTTAVGYDIREHLAGLVHPGRPGDDDVIMVGLTDSYLQYVTTADEYRLQHYEGASTLYGPHTAVLLRNHLACLVPPLYGGGDPGGCGLGKLEALNTARRVEYDPTPVARMPPQGGPDQPAPDLPDLLVPRPKDHLRPVHQVTLDGPRIGVAQSTSVRIVDVEHGEVLDDDRGAQMEVRYDATRPPGERWVVRWAPPWPPGSPPCGRAARFEITVGHLRRSRPFTVKCRSDAAKHEAAP